MGTRRTTSPCWPYVEEVWTPCGAEKRTVSGNFHRLQQDYIDSIEVFSIKKSMPVIGTNEVKDRVGMGITLMTLNSSLRIGGYLDTIQWDTMRNIPTWWTNAFEAGKEYGEGEI